MSSRRENTVKEKRVKKWEKQGDRGGEGKEREEKREKGKEKGRNRRRKYKEGRGKTLIKGMEIYYSFNPSESQHYNQFGNN